MRNRRANIPTSPASRDVREYLDEANERRELLETQKRLKEIEKRLNFLDERKHELKARESNKSDLKTSLQGLYRAVILNHFVTTLLLLLFFALFCFARDWDSGGDLLTRRARAKLQVMEQMNSEELPVLFESSIVDSHVHFWDDDKVPRSYTLQMKLLSWMKPEYRHQVATFLFLPRALLNTLGEADFYLMDYNLNNLKPWLISNNVSRTVYIENMAHSPRKLSPLVETKWQQSVSDGNIYNRMPNAIVGFVNLLGTRGSIEANMKQYMRLKNFRAVRYTLAYTSKKTFYQYHTADVLSNYIFSKSFSTFSQFDVLFETYVYHHQLYQLADLADEFPNTRIIIDHAGGLASCKKPLLDCKGLKRGLKRVAAQNNTYIKISGFGMPIVGLKYHLSAASPSSDVIAADIGPLVEYIIDLFGYQRVMFGSNFPYDSVSFSYTNLINAYKKIVSIYPPAVQMSLLHDNAIRIYQM